MQTWSVRGVTALVTVAFLANGLRAADLGFPESCVELANAPPRGLHSHSMSPRDSVMFAIDAPNRKMNPGEAMPFIAWDTQTGKWLARMPAPDPHAMGWRFSPDGTLLAIPIVGRARTVELWEVGKKDSKGVPALRLLTKLLQRNHRPALSEARAEGHASFGDLPNLLWTPDSKTLLAHHDVGTEEIQFWSRTDKPSVWDDSDRDTKWKPWAIIELGSQLRFHFTVSPNNRSLAVIKSSGAQPGSRESIRPGSGQIFDLEYAKLREEFQVQRPPINSSESHGYRLQYSDDSQTLAINDTGNVEYLALWDTTPLAPRVEMDAKVLGISNLTGFNGYNMAFLHDNRWLLTVKETTNDENKRLTGGLLQFRDAQSGELRKEVGFPKELGRFNWIEKQPDGRLMTRFDAYKKSQERVTRYFLWSEEDLLRYATEHGSTPSPKAKAK